MREHNQGFRAPVAHHPSHTKQPKMFCLPRTNHGQYLGGLLLVASVAVVSLNFVAQTSCSPQASSLPWMTQVAALSGQKPKLKSAPLVQLDTSNEYYKTVVEGMVYNFKRAVGKASELMLNSTSRASAPKDISLIGGAPNGQAQQRVSVQELQIEGIGRPKVSNVYVNKKNMKLHVVFSFKNLRVSGKCVQHAANQKPATGSSRKLLMEVANWNTSWSANVMQMIGRDHFDMNRVYTTHSQQRLSMNLGECPQVLHEKLKAALLERVRSSVESQLVDIMETVMMRTEVLADEAAAPPAAAAVRGKRASAAARLALAAATSPKKSNPLTGAAKGTGGAKQKALKRTKRQTPCQQGEELDDYVDQLFRFGTRLIRAMEPITTPNTTIDLPDYNIKIFLYDGKGTRAYKFKRAKPAWVFCSNETISLGVTVAVEELRVAYKYRVISGTRLVFDGDLEARLSPRVQAQFSQAVQEEDSEEPVQQRIDRVRLMRLGRVHVLIRGLGNLTQSLSMLINSYLNDNQEELQPTFRMMEGDAVTVLNRFVANLNVPLLSVV